MDHLSIIIMLFLFRFRYQLISMQFEMVLEE